MMKIAVVCANGKAGQAITEELIRRGQDVTAIVRKENKSQAPNAIIKDIFAITGDDLKPFDVVIDAFGAWTADTLPQLPQSLEHLCNALSGSQARLLVVGGAGSLLIDKERGVCVADAPDFPDIFKPVAAAHAQALAMLRKRQDVRWTYVSPACDFQAQGERTGKYLVGGEELLLNAQGESVISYADYAVAMADEALNGKHIQQRISVVKA